MLLSTLIPSEQLQSSLADTGSTSGEIALRRAILEDALACFQKQTVTGGQRVQRLAREAEEWLFTNDYAWPFSFVNVCAALKLDPGYIRLGLKRWRQDPPAHAQKRYHRPPVINRSLNKIAA
jgi:hypothetical protein